MSRSGEAILLGAFLWSGLIFTGCQQGPHPATTLPEGELAAEDAADVVVLEPDLIPDITVPERGVRAARLPDGRLKVQARLINTAGEELSIQIQTVFKDGEGFVTESPSNWTFYILSDGDSLNYECSSLNAKATTYVVKVRRAES
ncbi:MAG: hypothetical protein AB1486_04755 [Planctomycetota bacterium]